MLAAPPADPMTVCRLSLPTIELDIDLEAKHLTLPTGVAHKLMPGELLMLQIHYVNAITQTTPPSATISSIISPT